MKTAHLVTASLLALLIGACSKSPEPEPEAVAPVADSAVTPAAALPDTPTAAAAPAPAAEPEAAKPAEPAVTAAEPVAAPAMSPAPESGAPAAATAAAGGDIVKGWKTWRAAACERCHGAAQEGMVGPSLIESLKRLSQDEFRKTVLEGRLERGMPGHPYLADKIDDLYVYLKGRSDGSVAKVRPEGA
jgi:hypothetical protein